MHSAPVLSQLLDNVICQCGRWATNERKPAMNKNNRKSNRCTQHKAHVWIGDIFLIIVLDNFIVCLFNRWTFIMYYYYTAHNCSTATAQHLDDSQNDGPTSFIMVSGPITGNNTFWQQQNFLRQAFSASTSPNLIDQHRNSRQNAINIYDGFTRRRRRSLYLYVLCISKCGM